MNHDLKLWLRSLSHKSELFSKAYRKISLLKVSHDISVSDEAYLKAKFKENTGKKLHISHPKTYNEKLQWLKLNERNPLYTILADKYAVRKFVAQKIGDDHLIPLLGVWDRFEKIDFDQLPDEFVLKCTHDCGSIVICRDKKSFDLEYARKKLTKALALNYYYVGREWPYKNIPPKIIAEKYMVDESGDELKDYKIFCFNGVAKLVAVYTDRYKIGSETTTDYYDMEFNHLPFTIGRPNAQHVISKPDGFDQMKKLAESLSQNIPHVRVDLYNINGEVYFGEMTFYHKGGMAPFVPEEWDKKFGSWIDLSLANDHTLL